MLFLVFINIKNILVSKCKLSYCLPVYPFSVCKLVCLIFCCNTALRTTRGSLCVCMYVCMSLLAFLPFTQKIFKQPIPQNL